MALSFSYSSVSTALLLLATVATEIASQQPEANSDDQPPWNYDLNSPYGPDNWKQSYPMCGDQFQSPINFETSGAGFNNLLTDFNYKNYDNTVPSNFELTNTGHSIQLSPPSDSEISISGGGLTDNYILSQLHFHWGKDSQQGSEHRINEKPSAAEIHLVHWKKEHGSFPEALNYSDGVAVLGVFVQVSNSKESSGSVLGNLTLFFDEIPFPGNTTTVSSFALKSLLPEIRNYFRYQGSLTTPACAESVIWTVFQDPIYLDESEMARFRSIYGSEGEKLQDNFRPTQPLNGRVVYTSFPSSTNHIQPISSAMVLVTLSAVLTTVSLICST